MHKQLIILGSGPAGCTAAIYAARANLQPCLLTGIEQGGQLTKTSLVANWPGAYDGILGPVLMENLLEHSKKYQTEIISDQIKEVNLQKRPFLLQGELNSYSCEALIIATGASAKYLGLPSEQQYLGRGVSGCAVCDGFFYRGAKVLVVGGGNSAVADALYLANIAKEVTLIHRRKVLTAEPIDVARLQQTPNIKVIFEHTLVEVLGDSTVTGAIIQGVTSKETTKLDLEGIFIAIGHQPNSGIFEGQLAMEEGYIVVHNGTATSVPGVFAAGDVADKRYRQAITSAGTGCMAALDVKKYLAYV